MCEVFLDLLGNNEKGQEKADIPWDAQFRILIFFCFFPLNWAVKLETFRLKLETQFISGTLLNAKAQREWLKRVQQLGIFPQKESTRERF